MNRDSIYSALVVLMKDGRRLRPATAVDHIVRHTGLARLAVIDGLARLGRENVISGVTRDGRPAKMISWLVPPAIERDPFQDRWSALIRDQPSALPPPKAVRDLEDQDLESLALCLSAINTTVPGLDEDRYVVSANAIMGSSKALDAFPGLIAEDIRQRPLFVITAGPATPKNILFVENPSAFTSLMRGPFIGENLAVCAFGYGLTMENLGQRLLDGAVIPCTSAGQPVVDLMTIISSTPCFHWGDLDLEGMRIFETLSASIPHIRLPAIYGLMAARLSDPRKSHPYAALFGKQNQRSPRAADPIVAYLAQACATRALDQESMCPVDRLDLLTTPFVI
jgi:hypothetical protein